MTDTNVDNPAVVVFFKEHACDWKNKDVVEKFCSKMLFTYNEGKSSYRSQSLPAKQTTFEKSEYSDSLYFWQKGSLRCTAILLSDGSLCLYSPVARLSSQAIESLSETGNVQFLLAPNHYHNKGIREYADAFPEATLCSSEAAISRLEKQTKLSFESLDVVSSLLPEKASILQPQGLKMEKCGWR